MQTTPGGATGGAVQSPDAAAGDSAKQLPEQVADAGLLVGSHSVTGPEAKSSAIESSTAAAAAPAAPAPGKKKKKKPAAAAAAAAAPVPGKKKKKPAAAPAPGKKKEKGAPAAPAAPAAAKPVFDPKMYKRLAKVPPLDGTPGCKMRRRNEKVSPPGALPG